MNPNERLLQMLRAAGERRRLDLLFHLSRGSRTGGELLEAVPISQPTLSRHLKVLRDAGLITEESLGRTVRYALEPNPFVLRILELAGLTFAPAESSSGPGVSPRSGDGIGVSRSDRESPPPDEGTPGKKDEDFQEWLL